jgi:2,5-furandicarboxylate decarboxylase 1
METQMNTRDAATQGALSATSFSPPRTWAEPSGVLTLRGWLAHLARTGRLATIDGPIALEHELAAVAKRLDGTQAAFFTRPGRHDIPVVSGFMSKHALKRPVSRSFIQMQSTCTRCCRFRPTANTTTALTLRRAS